MQISNNLNSIENFTSDFLDIRQLLDLVKDYKTDEKSVQQFISQARQIDLNEKKLVELVEKMVMNDWLDALKELINLTKKDVNELLKDLHRIGCDHLLLLASAQSEGSKILKFLLSTDERNYMDQEMFEPSAQYAMRPLGFAIYTGSLLSVKIFLNAGVDIGPNYKYRGRKAVALLDYSKLLLNECESRGRADGFSKERIQAVKEVVNFLTKHFEEIR
jgi:hypothetical protein